MGATDKYFCDTNLGIFQIDIICTRRIERPPWTKVFGNVSTVVDL